MISWTTKRSDTGRLTFALSVFLTIATCATAHAQGSLPGSEFEIDADANLRVDSTTPQLLDWGNVEQKFQDDDASGSGDNAFGQGAKEDTEAPSVVSGSIPPNKSDLKTFGVYLEDKGLNGKFLHVYWARVQDPSGTTLMDFEFNQSGFTSANGVTPVRTEDDLLLQYELAQGGTVPDIFVSRWRAADTPGNTASMCEASNKLPCWSARQELSDEATGSINLTTIPEADSDGLGQLSPRTFGEASIDFDALGTTSSTGCTNFGSAHLKSRSSDSFTAALKDFITPRAISISNCASIKIIKADDLGKAMNGVKFDLFKESGDDDTAYNPAEDTATLYTCTTGLPVGSSSGTCTINNILAGTYWIVEDSSSVKPGYDPISTPQKVVIIAGDDAIQEFTFTNAVQRGTIEIDKVTVPAGSLEEFTFNPSWLQTSIKLKDGDAKNVSNNLLPSDYDGTGNYSVTESAQAGWTQTSATCTSDKRNGTISPTAIDLQSKETVTCTFTNTQKGKIKVTKQTLPDGDTSTTFNFSGDITASLKDGQTSTEVEVVPGTYTVTEAATSGWDLTDITCSDANDASGQSSGVVATGVATFDVSAGEIVECTFTNTQKGKIKVTKQTLPDGDTSTTFNFSGDITASLKDGQTSTEVEVVPGTYTVTEAATSGWDLTDITCSDANDASGQSSGVIATGVATFNVSAGETVDCTFTNTQKAKIKVTKQTLPDGDTSTVFSFSGEISASLKDGESSTEKEVEPGTYTVTEAAKSGWDLTDITCSDANDASGQSSGVIATGVATFNVSAGEAVECTFTNTQKGKIMVKKLAQAYSSTQKFGFSGDITASLGHNETSTAVSVKPGTYSVTETVPTGWKLTDISCSDSGDASGASSGVTSTGITTFKVAAGEEVTCTYTNVPLTDIEVKVDSLVPGGTNSTIECKKGADVVGSKVGPTDDPSLTLSNQQAGTYVCTIVVDDDSS